MGKADSIPKLPLAPPWLRSVVAGIAGMVGGALLFVEEIDGTLVILIPVGALVLAAIAVHARSLGAQLFARAAWWSNFTLGVFLSMMGSGRERVEGGVLALGTAIALLVAEPKRLAVATERGGYRPVAYRGTLQLMMVFAIADALTMMLFGAISMDDSRGGVALWLFGSAALFMIGFVGLYRLALWGILATAGTALVLGVLLTFRIVAPDRDFLAPLLFVCFAQPAVVTPMLVSMVRKRPLPSLPRGVSTWIERAIVIAGALVAFVAMTAR